MAHAIGYHALLLGFDLFPFFLPPPPPPHPRPYFILLALSIPFPPLIYIQMEFFNMEDNIMLH